MSNHIAIDPMSINAGNFTSNQKELYIRKKLYPKAESYSVKNNHGRKKSTLPMAHIIITLSLYLSATRTDVDFSPILNHSLA